ncbi:conserved hypothetical protein, partial [Ricinus communis]
SATSARWAAPARKPCDQWRGPRHRHFRNGRRQQPRLRLRRHDHDEHRRSPRRQFLDRGGDQREWPRRRGVRDGDRGACRVLDPQGRPRRPERPVVRAAGRP